MLAPQGGLEPLHFAGILGIPGKNFKFQGVFPTKTVGIQFKSSLKKKINIYEDIGMHTVKKDLKNNSKSRGRSTVTYG